MSKPLSCCCLLPAEQTNECWAHKTPAVLLACYPAISPERTAGSQGSFPATSCRAEDDDLGRCWSSTPLLGLKGGMGWRALASTLLWLLIPQHCALPGTLPGLLAWGGLEVTIESRWWMSIAAGSQTPWVAEGLVRPTKQLKTVQCGSHMFGFCYFGSWWVDRIQNSIMFY